MAQKLMFCKDFVKLITKKFSFFVMNFIFEIEIENLK